jgi:thermostable 8-oxoguanine DNA glycosylase
MKKIYDQDLNSRFPEEVAKARTDYKFQPELTRKLDALEGEFTETTLLEIVLWKVNRYPQVPPELLTAINDLRKGYTEEKAKALLKIMLDKKCKGFDLPMASTVLRFASPEHLQIIDQRVYRFITPGKDKLKLPFNSNKKIELYFEYIKMLKAACEKHGVDFKESDRIFYQLDKIHNKKFPIHKPTSDDMEE